MKELIQALENAADGAFIVDAEYEVVYANQAAQQTLDLQLGDGRPRLCYQILHGRDEGYRLICNEYCPVARQILSGRKVNNFDLNVAVSDDDLWVNMSVFKFSCVQDQKPYIIHLFRDVTQKKREVELVERLVEVAKQYDTSEHDNDVSSQARAHPREELTGREREVLSLLAQGHSTRKIARELSISVNTTRNHIQNILQKLNVHTRLEAVIYAIHHNLIDQIV